MSNALITIIAGYREAASDFRVIGALGPEEEKPKETTWGHGTSIQLEGKRYFTGADNLNSGGFMGGSLRLGMMRSRIFEEAVEGSAGLKTFSLGRPVSESHSHMDYAASLEGGFSIFYKAFEFYLGPTIFGTTKPSNGKVKDGVAGGLFFSLEAGAPLRSSNDSWWRHIRFQWRVDSPQVGQGGREAIGWFLGAGYAFVLEK